MSTFLSPNEVSTSPDNFIFRYIHVETGAYPITADAIRHNNPNTSFGTVTPDIAKQFGFETVHRGDVPEYDSRVQRLVEVKPVKIEGRWITQYETVDLSESEQEAIQIQIQRDAKHFAQAILDEFAEARKYSSIVTLCSYINSSNPVYRAEAQQGIEARDAIWASLFDVFSKIDSGELPKPKSSAELTENLVRPEWT